MEEPAHFAQEGAVTDGVPSGIGGDGIAGIRYQGHLVGNDLQHELAERLRAGVAFYVEFSLEQRTDSPYVAVADVPFIGPGMDGDALGSELFAVQGGGGHVRHICAARIAQRGYLVDVYA